MATSVPLDGDGLARQALAVITSLPGFEATLLSNGYWMRAHLGNLLSELPRERAVLCAAASVGAAEELRKHIAAGVPSDDAVARTARLVADQTGLALFASTWAVTELAIALDASH